MESEGKRMTPTEYLESQGYTVEPVRGMVEVWLGNMLVLSDLTDAELAAFAERVRVEKEGGEAMNEKPPAPAGLWLSLPEKLAEQWENASEEERRAVMEGWS